MSSSAVFPFFNQRLNRLVGHIGSGTVFVFGDLFQPSFQLWVDPGGEGGVLHDIGFRVHMYDIVPQVNTKVHIPLPI